MKLFRLGRFASLWVVFLWLGWVPLFSQEPWEKVPFVKRQPIGSLSGVLADSATGQGLEYGAVSLLLASNDSLVGGVLSGKGGAFTLTDLRPAHYKVKLDFIGYKPLILQNITITPGPGAKVELGKVFLAEAGVTLGPVEIRDQGDVIRNGLDKKVFQVDQLMTAQGGSAADILKNIPSVDVDIDGGITLRGSGNVTVLIDGKPSSITGGSRQAILDQIPATTIERIEVINNPSARYDPDGMTGIINIITKKSKKPGVNGGVTLSLGSPLNKYTGSANISLRKKRFNVFANYSYRDETRWHRGSYYRETYSPYLSTLTQASSGDRIQRGHTAKAGFDFYPGEKSTIYFSTLIGYSTPVAPEQMNATETRGDTLYNRYTRETENDQLMRNVDFTLGYEHRFPQQGHTFQTDLTSSLGQVNEWNDYTQTDSLIEGVAGSFTPTLQRDQSLGGMGSGTLRGDYVRPLSHQDRLEMGYKAIRRQMGSDFLFENYDEGSGTYVYDSTRSNDFRYREQIFALYAQYARPVRAWAFQVGVRAEQALTRSVLVTTADTFHLNYFNLFPSATLSRRISENNEVKLSYSKRINRPGVDQLNPFPDYSNSQVLRYGNPYIKPEYTHSFDLGYQRFFKKGNFTTALYYRDLNNMMARIIQVDTNGISRVTFTNLAGAINAGFEGTAEYQPLPWWSLNLNFNAYRTWIDGSNTEAAVNNSGYSYMVGLISTMNLPKGINFQTTIRQRGPTITPQGSIVPVLTLDAAIRKGLWKGKGNISLRVSDMANRQRFGININQEDFISQGRRKPESRIAYLSFTYNFGQSEKGPGRKKPDTQDYYQGGGEGF